MLAHWPCRLPWPASGRCPASSYLLVFGLVNILTIAALTEAVTRHGGMRFGGAFLGQLVNDYLGPQAAAFAAAGLIVLNVLGLIAYFNGFATTLAGMIHLPPLFWMALLGLAVLYFLRGKSMDATIGTTLVISAVNLALILALLLLTIPHVQPEYLLYASVPFVGGQPFDSSLLALIFGTVLLAFFGHTAVINGAGVMLRRDPGGRSFVRGAIAAEALTTAVYSVWVLAVNGSVPAETLSGTQSTVLTPLAAVVGPAVNVFGLLFMLLAVAVASIQTALGLFNLAREWLPAPQAPTVVLPRRQGQLVLAPRPRLWSGPDAAGPTLRLTYLGPDRMGRGRFRIQGLPGDASGADCGPAEATIVVGENWDGAAPGNPLASLGPRATTLRLQVEQATRHWVRLRVFTSLTLRYEGTLDTAGLQMGDLLDLPPEEAEVLSCLVRAGEAGPAEVAAATSLEPAAVSATLAALAARGQVQVTGAGAQARYRAQFGRRRARQVPDQLAQALAEPAGQPGPGAGARSGGVAGSLLQRLSPTARFWVAASPILVIWLLAAAALLAGFESFTAPMAFSGTIAASLLSGIFPVLLLAAGRRRGDLLPASAPRFLGRPLVLGGIFALYLAAIVLYGLFIWQQPVMRLSALAAACLAALVTANILRRDYLRPRLVVELRDETCSSGQGLFAVSNGGCAAPATVRLTFAPAGQDLTVANVQAAAGPVPDFAALRVATFAMPVAGARDLKIWVHRTDPDGLSQPLPALVQVTSGAASCSLRSEESGGQVLVPLQGAECLVTIELDSTTAARAAAQTE